MEMKPKEAIEVFKKIRLCDMEDVCIEDCYDCQYNIPVHVVLEAESISIPALEKQIPKRIQYIYDGYADGKPVYDQAECPNCGYIYDDTDSAWKEPFCPHCGQAIDWSE